nr:integumentary mucin C.1-like [Procambarus clarkii]
MVTQHLPSRRPTTATLVALLVLAATCCRSVDGFSFGQLFPASRRGVRGSLLNSFFPNTATKNALKEAVRQAAAIETTTTTTTTTPATTTTSLVTVTTPEVKKPTHPVTNSPIYYIRLPPSPYVYMPGLGYVSPNNNQFNFVRPDVDFINNGKPSNIFHFKAPTTTTKAAPTTVSTTTAAPTTTTTAATTTTSPSSTTTKPPKPSPMKKPSPITWLPGPWFFNGRPNNLFIFRSPYNPSHFDKLHQTYSKPGIYLK